MDIYRHRDRDREWNGKINWEIDRKKDVNRDKEKETWQWKVGKCW